MQEKLDGSCVAVARVDGCIIPLTRAGYPAHTSPWEQHQLFEAWVWEYAYEHDGGPLAVQAVLAQLEPSGHGALDPVEGAVWRVERRGKVDFLAKFIRPEKLDGTYLPDVSGLPAVWNWRPSRR